MREREKEDHAEDLYEWSIPPNGVKLERDKRS